MAKPRPPPPTDPSSHHITTLYRQRASAFLARSDAAISDGRPPDDALASWIGDAARALALRAATPINGARIDGDGKEAKAAMRQAKKLSAKEGKITAEDVIQTLPPSWADFVCAACGTFLFPPANPNGTSADGTSLASAIHSSQAPLPGNICLRPMKRGRTRRRRASRAKAKELHDRSLSLQRRGTSNANIQLRKETLQQEEMRRIASSYRVGDGRSRQCLVMTCTHCGTKKKRKGIDVKPDKKTGARDGAGQKKQKAKQPEKRPEKETVASQIRDNTDYISLASFGEGAKLGEKKPPQHKGQAHSAKRKQDVPDVLASPLLGGKKKKRKKKPEAKKGALMDFLSSLND
ncbi:hypothetical protein ACHAXT_003836 [Thalassiosira profunda]